MPPTPEETQRREDYRRMYEQTRSEGAFALPELSGYVNHDTAKLMLYVLDVREAIDRQFTKGEFQALQAVIAEHAHATARQAFRRELRARATQARLQVQATYDAAFRAGYRARKILHAENAQKSFQRGYARGKAEK